jgi:hypothetical protein
MCDVALTGMLQHESEGNGRFRQTGKCAHCDLFCNILAGMLTVMCDNVVVSHFQRLGRLGFRLRLSNALRSLLPALDLVAMPTRELTVIYDGRINGQRDTSGR